MDPLGSICFKNSVESQNQVNPIGLRNLKFNLLLVICFLVKLNQTKLSYLLFVWGIGRIMKAKNVKMHIFEQKQETLKKHVNYI